MRKNDRKKGRAHSVLLVLASILAGAGNMMAGPGGSGYHLLKKVKLGGLGGWDYLTVDQATHRIFISRGTHVMVVDPEQGKVLGDVPDTQGIHGIALAAEFNKGFTSNGRSATSTVFDMTTLKTLGEAKTDKDPDAILYDPSSHELTPATTWFNRECIGQSRLRAISFSSSCSSASVPPLDVAWTFWPNLTNSAPGVAMEHLGLS